MAGVSRARGSDVECEPGADAHKAQRARPKRAQHSFAVSLWSCHARHGAYSCVRCSAWAWIEIAWEFRQLAAAW